MKTTVHNVKRVNSHEEFLEYLNNVREQHVLVDYAGYDGETSPYSAGAIEDGDEIMVKIYKHKKTGQLPYYTWKWGSAH